MGSFMKTARSTKKEIGSKTQPKKTTQRPCPVRISQKDNSKNGKPNNPQLHDRQHAKMIHLSNRITYIILSHNPEAKVECKCMYPILMNFSGHILSSWVFMAVIGTWAAVFSIQYDLEKRKIPFWQFLVFMGGMLACWFAGAQLGQILTVGTSTVRLQKNLQVSGLMLYGGVLSCILSGAILWWVLGWPRKLLIQELWDCGTLALCWAFLFGRIGCALYGCCYGTPSGSWPGYLLNADRWPSRWDVTAHPFPRELLGVTLHPTPLYEAFGFFGILVALTWIRSQEEKKPGRFPPGVPGWICWISYGIVRFFLEFIRLDPRGPLHFGLSPSQCIALTMVSIGVFLIQWDKKKNRTPIFLK